MTHSSHPRISSRSVVPSPGSSSVSAASFDSSDESSHQLALTIAQAAEDRKGTDIVLLKVTDVSYLTDYFVIVTGFSNVQIRAIASSIDDKVQEQLQRQPLRVEGQAQGNWVLMDYGDVIAHIFLPKERSFYNLEAFWGHAEQIPLSLSTSSEIR